MFTLMEGIDCLSFSNIWNKLKLKVIREFLFHFVTRRSLVTIGLESVEYISVAKRMEMAVWEIGHLKLIGGQ